jgi:hypothetical protein
MLSLTNSVTLCWSQLFLKSLGSNISTHCCTKCYRSVVFPRDNLSSALHAILFHPSAYILTLRGVNSQAQPPPTLSPGPKWSSTVQIRRRRHKFLCLFDVTSQPDDVTDLKAKSSVPSSALLPRTTFPSCSSPYPCLGDSDVY